MDLKNSPELIDAFPSCKGEYDHHLKVGGYKVLLDGSPQSKTAWVTKPYTDGTEGYPMLSDEELEPLVERTGTAAAFDACQWGCGCRPVFAGI